MKHQQTDIHTWLIALASAFALTMVPVAMSEGLCEWGEELVSHRNDCPTRSQARIAKKQKCSPNRPGSAHRSFDATMRRTIFIAQATQSVLHQDRYSLNGIGAPLRC